ncbi:CCR4-NOT transcription complex subunit 11 [Aphelenchoides fujianensis]|nr:CCR4-NOT transcription complex subunit 11 [Aphelenchoides fujianensis]
MAHSMQPVYQMDLNVACKDIQYINSLFVYKDVNFKALGDRFLLYLRDRNPTVLCLYLLSLYEEHRFVAHVTQRLMITLRDLWPRTIVEKAGIYTHPYLLVLVKVYWNYASPPGSNPNDKSLIHLCGTFPKITAQEAHFVGRILTFPEAPDEIAPLSPSLVADTPIPSDNMMMKVNQLKAFVENQLRCFPFFEMVIKADPAANPLNNPGFMQFNHPDIIAEVQRIVLSLVPPSPRQLQAARNPYEYRGYETSTRRQELNSTYGGGFYTQQPQQYPAVPPPPHLANPHGAPPGVPAAYRPSTSNPLEFPPGMSPYQLPPGMAPADASRRQEFSEQSKMMLQQANAAGQHLGAIGTRPSPIGTRPAELPASASASSLASAAGREEAIRASYSASPASTATFQSASSNTTAGQRMPDPVGPPGISQHARSASPMVSAIPPPMSEEEQKLDDRRFALAVLKRVIDGGGSSLGKPHVTKVLSILSNDREILAVVTIGPRDFETIVEGQPDLAAEVLLQAHGRRDSKLFNYFEVILGSELSVQSMVAVSRYINSCERLSLMIPEEFLNQYITYCIQTCEKADANQLPTHRMVRMVCVFFTSLVRLTIFNVKPRVAEMQNFSTMFSSVKETSQLYQAIAQLK